MPAELTTGFCWVEVYQPGPAQLKVAGEAFVVTVSVTLVAVQVICPPVVAAVGGWILLVTVVDAVAVQPFVLFVTCKV